MKQILIALLSLTLFSCDAVSKFMKTTPPSAQAPSEVATSTSKIIPPPDYKEDVSYAPGEYAKIKITGRCMNADGTESDGPKESIPLLDGDSPSLKVLSVKKNALKTLYEVLQPATPSPVKILEFAAEQTGCSHFGYNFFLVTSETIDLTKTDDIWKLALSSYSKIPFSAHGKKQASMLEELMRDEKRPHECKNEGGRTLCAKYHDPNNLEFIVRPYEKDSKLHWIEYHYWYVM
ncbi:MAG: hypothetical protein JNL01_09005 [Bdellovibrionales bacterium]|nr:hypothetical protein [Bdellovibrionales bacterium]